MNISARWNIYVQGEGERQREIEREREVERKRDAAAQYLGSQMT